VIGINRATDAITRTIDCAVPDAPVGSSPQARHHPNGRTLYVANAGNNDVAVVDLPPRGWPSRVTGLIRPAGTDHGHADHDGRRLLVTNAKASARPQPRWCATNPVVTIRSTSLG